MCTFFNLVEVLRNEFISQACILFYLMFFPSHFVVIFCCLLKGWQDRTWATEPAGFPLLFISLIEIIIHRTCHPKWETPSVSHFCSWDTSFGCCCASNEGWGWDGAEVKGKSVHGVHSCKLDNGIAKESMGIDAGKETINESSSYSLKHQEHQLPFCFREWSSLLRPLGDLKERVVLTSVETFSPLQGSGARRRFTCFLPQNSNVQAWKLWSFSRYSPAFACYSWRAFLLLISMYTKESK